MVLWWRRSLPESPRYLLLRGRTAEAEQVVADFERRAEASLGTALPPVPPSVAAPEPIGAAVPSSRASLLAAVRFMWSRAMARRTAVVWVLWFVITFSYYGFFSWIPTLLINRGLTVTTSFSFSIIIYLAQVPGYFSAAWCNEKLDRRRTIAIYLVGSAISAFLLSQSDTSFTIVASGALLSFFLNGVYAGLYAYTPEVFPTWVRSTATRDVQRIRAHRQHHRTGDHRVLLGRARFRRGVHDDHGRPPGRGRGRARLRPRDRRSVAGGAERAAGVGRCRPTSPDVP